MGTITFDGNPSPAEMIFMHGQACGTSRWVPFQGGGFAPVSLSVFGTAGSRFSVMVLEKRSVTLQLAGRNGGWTLADRWNQESAVRFDLLWALDTGESDRVMLCGRESHRAFDTSA